MRKKVTRHKLKISILLLLIVSILIPQSVWAEDSNEVKKTYSEGQIEMQIDPMKLVEIDAGKLNNYDVNEITFTYNSNHTYYVDSDSISIEGRGFLSEKRNKEILEMYLNGTLNWNREEIIAAMIGEVASLRPENGTTLFLTSEDNSLKVSFNIKQLDGSALITANSGILTSETPSGSKNYFAGFKIDPNNGEKVPVFSLNPNEAILLSGNDILVEFLNPFQPYFLADGEKEVVFITGMGNQLSVSVEPDPDPTPDPGKPVDPITPGKPVDPITPGKPVDPITPGKPVDPIAPGKPVDPIAPGKPVDPIAPGKPADLIDPGKPVGPGKPANQVKPVNTVKPVKSLAPTNHSDGAPKTGDTSNVIMYTFTIVAAFATMLLSIIGLQKKKVRK